MSEDFEKRFGEAYRRAGAWTPPPLDAQRRKQLLALRGPVDEPFFRVIWNAAGKVGRGVLDIADMTGQALSTRPSPALLRGDDGQAETRIVECRLASGVLKLALTPEGGDVLRLSVVLDGSETGNFSVELEAAGDLLEARPLRRTAELSLRNGGVYRIAVVNGNEEVGKITLRLDRESGEVSS